MSTLQRYRFTVKIRVTAPVVSQAAGARGHGIDTTALCDRDNIPALPGTLLMGNLRETWGYFAELAGTSNSVIQQDLIDDWLGQPATDSSPRRGRLIFDEFWRAGTGMDTDVLHHRIAVEPNTGKVREGALQVIASPFVAGKEVVFSGGITAWLHGTEEAKDLQKWLFKGLHGISALGALKGVGFGRIIGVDVVQQAKELPRSKASAAICTEGGETVSGIGIILRPDRPFCFSRHSKGNNLKGDAASAEQGRNDQSGPDNQFISEDYIPGGAIKGALATLLRGAGKAYDLSAPINHSEYPLLSQYLDQLCITRAQPSDDPESRPLPLPLTTVAAEDPEGETCLYDIALMREAGLINGQAPTFSIDWKDEIQSMAAAQCAVPARPSRSLSIHAAMDRETGASADQQLFSIEAVNPEDDQKKYYWLANITLPAKQDGGPSDEQRVKIFRELKRLFDEQGLHWLGKTGASAEVEVHNKLFRPPALSVAYTVGTVLTITLLSHARLLKPGQIADATGAHEALFKAYAKNWSELSGGSLRLVDFYAAQELLGGAYWHKRYNKGKAYDPETFTVPGSVFVVEISDEDKVKERLRSWQLCGLPQLNDVFTDWRRNPWIRENGFGEIAVNLQQHRKLQPKAQQWISLDELAGGQQ